MSNVTREDLAKVLRGVVESTNHAKAWLESYDSEPKDNGTWAHVCFTDSYYRDNLLCLLESLLEIGAPVDTGDWFMEFIYKLKDACGGNADGANRNLAETKEMLLDWAGKVECKCKKKSTKDLKCVDCASAGVVNAVKWIRCTQFAGDHLFCLAHAKQEKDFLEEGGSSFFWTNKDKEGSVL